MRAFSGNTAGSQHLLPRRLHEEEQIEFLTDVSGDFGAGVGFLALAVGVGSLAYETATEPSDQRAWRVPARVCAWLRLCCACGNS